MAFEVLEAVLPAQALAAAAVVTIIGDVPTNEVETNWDAYRISLTSPALVTGVATNNATFNVRNVRGGAVQGTLATLTLGAGTNLAAETETVVPLSTPQNVTATSNVQAGDVLDVQMVQNGTGLAIPAGVVAKVELN